MIKGKPGNQMSYRMKKFLAKDINVMYKIYYNYNLNKRDYKKHSTPSRSYTKMLRG